ncbi:hypothetical protein [uncultured Winogradskyella sp.]|uniref:hypothetical protein n=1 Tax=uncultured Winogradskyella sp. TaxID=395353 RepID=UPI0026018ECF|nr:hypothetical protein [uncultured Winogradskyella sp.]
MEELKLHSFGQNDHIESLKKKYNSLKEKINGNKILTEKEKVSELKSLTESFKKEKKDSETNLY